MWNSFFLLSRLGFDIAWRIYPHICTEEVNTLWIADESLNTPSTYIDSDTEDHPFMDIDPARNVDWEVRIPFVKYKICSQYEENIPMYDVIFEDIGFRVPFLDFQKEVFKWLKLAPSHFHPNSMAFIMASEMMCRDLNLNLNFAFFFSVLTLQRGMDHDDGKIWVSLKQNTQFFKI